MKKLRFTLIVLLLFAGCVAGFAQGTFPQDVAVSADTTLGSSHMNHVVLATAGALGITLTLPAASSWHNSYSCILRVDSGAGDVTIARAGSDTINGAASYVLHSQYQFVCLLSDGSASWEIIGERAGAVTSFGTVIDGGGSALATGFAGMAEIHTSTAAGCTITNWTVEAPNEAGSIVVDIKRSGTSIIGTGNKPTLTASQEAAEVAVSGWTSTAIADQDKLTFNIDSASTLTWVLVSVRMTCP